MMDIKRCPRESLRNEKGMVLVVALLLISVLLLLGTTAVMTSTTDMKISANYKTGVQAFYAAEAGIAEAMKRLQGLSTASNYAGDPAATPALLWSAYILTSNSWQTSDDLDYSASYLNYIPTSASHTGTAITANSLQSVIPYFVKIRHKREYDAEQDGHTTAATHYYDNDGNTATHTAASPGNLIYWGYGKAATPTTAIQFTSSAATEFKPVEIIIGYGKNGTALKRIEAQVVRNPGPVVQAAIYAKGDIDGHGASMMVNGNDFCGQAPAKPPTYTKDPAVTNANENTTFPDPPGPQHGTLDVDVTGYVNSLKASATITITDMSPPDGGYYGSLASFETVYANATVTTQGLKMNNIHGYGILLVNGDLTLGGGFSWDGLVLCTGVLTFNGGAGGVNIRGAVMANQTVTINGGLDIKYDSCRINDALNSQAMQMISWREIY